jgi:hypothetical protein
MINKKNIPLIIALSVPVLMIILVAAFIYLPGLGKKPKANFLYESGNYVYDNYSGGYSVKNGQLVQTPPPVSQPAYYNQNQDVHFYLYDVKNNSATEVNFQQAQGYHLDSGAQSPDGFTVVQGNYSGGGDLFFGGGVSNDYNSWFIRGHNRSIKLNLKLISSQNYYNFKFLGWVE